MCRLFAYASPHDHAISNLLEAQEFEDFSALSDLHGDGWGMAWLPGTEDGSEAHVGATRSVSRAIDDPRYREFAATPMGRAGLIHIRWATPGFPIRVENSHPFTIGEWAFAHNGAIDNSERIEDLLSEETKALLESDTDSKRYFLLLVQRINELGEVVAGIRQTIADIRRVCGLGTLNCILLGNNVLVAVQSQGETPAPIEMLRGAVEDPKTLPAGHDETYYHLRYSLRGDSMVISSTGITAGEWTALDEDSVIVADLDKNAATIFPLADDRPSRIIAFGSASTIG